MLKKLLRYHACWDVTTVYTVMLYSQCIFTEGNIKNLQAFCADRESLEKEKYSEGKNVIMHYTPCVNHLPKYLFSMLIIFLEPVEKCVMNGILYSHHP